MDDQLLDNQRKEYLQLKIKKQIEDTLKAADADAFKYKGLGLLLGGLLGAGVSSGVNAALKHDGSLESFTPSAFPIWSSAIGGTLGGNFYAKEKKKKAIERLSNQLAKLTQA